MMSRKKELLDKIVRDPLGFTGLEFQQLLSPEMNLEFTDLRNCTLRLYDLNERTLLEQSNANTGTLGKLNRVSSWWRTMSYFKRVKKGTRLKPGNKMILAEGDSWFQFPLFVSDIIDWLLKRDDYLIYSIAYGGDWMTNIIYEGKYIAELSIHRPDVFLISGGGNDMVGSNRIAIMVSAHNGIGQSYNQEAFEKAGFELNDDFTVGRKFISKEFYSFIWILKAQYWKMFEQIKGAQKLKDMQIITQGYANAIPSYSRKWSFRYPHKSLVNWLLGTGKWLKRPLMMKGIPDQSGDMTDIHFKIVKTMIHEVNNMFIELSNNFTNVYHIDSRQLVTERSHWFDELHLKSHMYKKVAAAFAVCIDNYGPATAQIQTTSLNKNPRVIIVR